MKIKSAAIIGLGAVGGFFAPAFAKVLGEENFCVIAPGREKREIGKRFDSQWRILQIFYCDA